jgi:hypothetical protein
MNQKEDKLQPTEIRGGCSFIMERAKRRTGEEIAHLVCEMRASGQTPEEFCESRGIKLRTFRDWVSFLKKFDTRTPGMKGSEQPMSWLELGKSETTLNDAHISPPVAEVVIGRCIVRVTAGFDGILLADVCMVLAGLC